MRVLCWGLGRKITPPWAPNTLDLDKVLCVSCAPGAFAKKSLGQPCAEIFSVEFFIGKTQYSSFDKVKDCLEKPPWFVHAEDAQQ